MMVVVSATPGRGTGSIGGGAVDVASDPDALEPSRSTDDDGPGPPELTLAPPVGPDAVGDEPVRVLRGIDTIDGARRERLRELYEAHYRDLVRLACLLLDRTEAAEEVVQDAFVKLYGALDRIEDRDATPAYLRSMVMNGARSKLRRRQVVRRHPPTPEPHGEPADASVVLHEDQQEVIDALRSLPVRQRECLVLRYYGGCSEAEIAETLGIARGTVKSSISRAMATMSERLEGRR
jgi:RNA polymerase sigma-70 factor (sigma-E family)